MALAWQPTLFGASAPAADAGFATLARTDLDGEAWVDHAPGWLTGADDVFAEALERAPWEGRTVRMYDQRLEQPRLTAHGWDAAPAVVEDMRRLLSDRYGVDLVSVGWNLYRDGRDSVAWHGDRVARTMPTATVAIVSLGGRRRFLLRPKGGGRSVRFEVASGDLLVMGGSCQRTWQHSIPKVAVAAPRISITFRHAYDR
ncbi:MAG TPA: alpha-ketoglutarate-dependent dioxygenase AlkB [Acidimicrobiales bacterium]